MKRKNILFSSVIIMFSICSAVHATTCAELFGEKPYEKVTTKAAERDGQVCCHYKGGSHPMCSFETFNGLGGGWRVEGDEVVCNITASASDCSFFKSTGSKLPKGEGFPTIDP